MSEVNIFQIEIPKRVPNCMHGNEAFIAGMEYYSVLISDEKGYQRHDFCLSCWENEAKNKFNETAKTAWKAKIASKQEIEDLSLKTRDEKAFYLLKESLQNSEIDWAETFVLALYLARRRALYLRQEIPQEDGSILCLYEVATTEEMLPIKRKSWQGINLEEIQQKIAKKLKG